ncbi:disease resistance protein RPV1 [Ziziphus jujuba]|uniref:Disease resistance protein RPV1 n=1 Tax=Ziziphus jujuba TaxID=326968 RepID=A0A6P6G568_ZIZJJ|nr:disease resistance protein RPV1 [Ziziphus jujuba]
MHSLIRQMGQAIVCDENKEPGNRSRLWKVKDVCHVLERNTGSYTMEGMLLDLSEVRKDVKVRLTAFSNMYHLRFLRFHYGFFFQWEKYFGWAPYNKMYLPSEGIDYLSDELRYFQWDLYLSKHLPSNFSPENLIELIMRGSQLVELPWNEDQPIGNLMKVDLGYCEGLTQIQNLCGAINLQWINIEGCTSLVQVPSWFKNLNKLEHLDLGCCMNLKDGLENLPLNIRVLSLYGTAIEALPSSFGRLVNLEYLHLGHCKNLKDGIENLPLNLQILYLSECRNLEDVQNISSSMDITELKLVGTGIKTLPESIWKMRFLKYLNLHDCPKLEKLQEISDDCMSSSLQMLNIRGCARLKSIPKSIWKMSSLRDLNLYDCPNLEILPEISDDCMSSSLERLISDCTTLKSIPESIWKMSSLTYLSLYDCPNLEKLQEISDDCMSSSLEWSDIRDCTRLCGPINLRWISLSTSLVRVPTWFKNLNKLEQLDLDYCKNLKDGLENLPLNIRDLSLYGTAIEALPSSFGRLLNLEWLNMSHCKNLKDGIENLPLNLRRLYLSGCTRLKSIPVLPSGLNILDASNCSSLETISSRRDLQQAEGIMKEHDFKKHEAVYPGNEIPEWFSHQTDDGNSLHIQLPPNWFSIHDPFFGFLFSIVFMLNGSWPYILLEINFKTNVNSDDHLHGPYRIPYPLSTVGGRDIYRCDHVFIADVKLNLKYLFGEEWSSVCSNVTEASFRASIHGVGDVVVDWEIKKFGLGLANKWGIAIKVKDDLVNVVVNPIDTKTKLTHMILTSVPRESKAQSIIR